MYNDDIFSYKEMFTSFQMIVLFLLVLIIIIIVSSFNRKISTNIIIDKTGTEVTK